MILDEYEYDDLPAADSYIRLIKLAPQRREDHGPISLTLTTLPLSKAAGTYDAISYTWGSFLPLLEVEVEIEIDNGKRRLWLRRNIWRFLKQCSSTGLGGKLHEYLWIDSICINQSNLAEKNVQVQQMASIFSHAKQVVVWLGEASRRSLWAGCMEGRYARMAEFMRESQYHPNIHAVDDDALKVDIRGLMTADYWTRLWIVQELALANQAVFVSGSELVDLTVLLGLDSLAGYFFQINGVEDASWRRAAKQVSRLVQRHLYRETQTTYHGLAPLVGMFAEQECFDPHDRVYALLGLVDDGRKVEVDYGIDMEELFWQVLEITHGEMDELTSGTRRDSYQWSIEALVDVLGLKLSDILGHASLQSKLKSNHLSVEMKMNGRFSPSVEATSSLATTTIFSLTIRRYFYGEVCILIASDLSYVRLAYVYDPLLFGYGERYDDKSVEVRQLDIPSNLRQDIVSSMTEQAMTDEQLAVNAAAGRSISLRFAFKNLLRLSRLEKIGEEYFQGVKNSLGFSVGPRNWPGGVFPWLELVSKAIAALDLRVDV